MITIKTESEIALMRYAGAVTAKTLKTVEKHIKPGVTTMELNRIAEDAIRSGGCTPAFLNYMGYPASICVSVNDEVVHGIPSSRKLVQGDIVSIDCGAVYKGYYGDAANTFPVGEISAQAKKLIDVTRQSLQEAMVYAKEGCRLGDISHAVQSYVEANGFFIVRDYVGHGIGSAMHESPSIPNYGKAGRGIVLRENMTLAVEPMVNAGTYEVKVQEDGWTAVTADGMYSAHYEHTLLIKPGGCEILTVDD
jgi:methionyl aminopeptidase